MIKTISKPKVLVALSGGVDSAVAAALLLEQGYDVTGGFIKNWSDSKDPMSGVCSWRAERRDAIRVAAALDIPLLTFDFEKQYRKKIVDELYKGYKRGETPNPDVLCNEYIKFGLFFDEAMKLGYDMIATGHYARTEQRTGLSSTNNELRTIKTIKHNNDVRSTKYDVRLLKGKDPSKDQSYFLYRVPGSILRRTLLPIGAYQKSEIRELAKKFKLPVANKADSQGICFIGKVDFSKFLSNKIQNKPGNIVTAEGEVIGKHQGLHNYTIGQRQRIRVAGNHPWFVAKKDTEKNQLVVADSEDHPLLQAKELIVDDLHWIAGQAPKMPLNVKIQARYHGKEISAKICTGKTKKTIHIKLAKPLVAAAQGQSAVIYKGKECLGGGIIRKVINLC
ncbi:tRNA 2-thiouridine(34) synthase MnmA [Candidatus Uhrbacteria bacterium]|nr:tRNA 2-thiouridine(34) synthase MnmA [Candidatus Uhrbacteria bacterium]